MVAVDEKKDGHPPIAPTVEHFTTAERAARGRAARAECPRSSHASFELPPDRDPVAILEAQATSRVPELVPVRYGRMLVSPFTFYRGAAAVMAHDLAATPRAGLQAQLCGDAHLSNFGGFASPERTLVFDLNDFDETLPGPFEWDVKRLAASFEIAGRDRDFTEARAHDGGAERRPRLPRVDAGLAEARNLDVWYARLDVETIEQTSPRDAGQAAGGGRGEGRREGQDEGQPQGVREADAGGRRRAAHRVGSAVDRPGGRPGPGGGIQFEQLESVIHGLFRQYRQTLQHDRRHLLEEFRMVDLARKVVGVGSVGTRCWILLMLGRDGDDPLFLQIKEAQASVLEPYLGKSEYGNHGQRVVEGQRLMQASSDIFLGWVRTKVTLDGSRRDFFVRQLWDWKTSVDLDAILPEGLALYGEVCGSLLARAHARSGDRIAISSLSRQERHLRPGDRRRSRSPTPTRTSATTPRCGKAADEHRITVQEGL